MTEDRLLTTGEAAKAVGLSHRSLSRWTAEGRLRPTLVTPGGHPRWTEADLREQLERLRE